MDLNPPPQGKIKKYSKIKMYKAKSNCIKDVSPIEPVVSRELFERVQKLIEERKQKYLDGKEKHIGIERKENKLDNILFCGDCGGRLKLHSQIVEKKGRVRVYYKYIYPNSESYGEKFCKKKKIKMQDLEEAVESALRMHMNLFLDAKEVQQGLNRTAQAKQKYVKEAENLTQKLSELAAMQTTYEAEYAGSQDFAKIMEQYAGFEELTSEIVHALISRIVFFGDGRIEIEYAFADELRAFVELTENRKGEIVCMRQAV